MDCLIGDWCSFDSIFNAPPTNQKCVSVCVYFFSVSDFTPTLTECGNAATLLKTPEIFFILFPQKIFSISHIFRYSQIFSVS